MKHSSFKEKSKDILDDARETASYAVRSPMYFIFEALRGTALIAEEHLFEEDKKTKRARLYDDRCKRCAKLAWVGILALAILAAGVKAVCKSNQSKQKISQTVQMVRE